MLNHDCIIPIDPFALYPQPATWRGQLEQGHLAKSKAKDDEDDDDEDDDEDDDDEDDDEDDLAELSEDELRAELKKTRESLSKASGSSKAKRDKIKRLTKELDDAKTGKSVKPKPKAKDDDEDDDTIDAEALLERGRSEGRKAGDDAVKRSKLETALTKAGIKDDKTLARLAKSIDLDELDLNDDGTVDGIDDVIDELKADMPALFGTTRKRRSTAGEPDGDGRRERREPKNMSASERQAALLNGRKE